MNVVVVDAPDTHTHETTEGTEPPAQRGCHLLSGITTSLCGLRTSAGRPFYEPGVNCLGPVCDGPGGCGHERCPACAAKWVDLQMVGRER